MAYAPIVRYQVELPPLSAVSLKGDSPVGDVFIGAFSAAASEVWIWQRLLGNLAATIYFGAKEEDIQAVVSPSMMGRVWLGDSASEWADFVQPDREERAFAVVRKGNIAEMLVIGAPTEEVWEELEARAKAASGILPA